MSIKTDCHAIAKCPASFYLMGNGCINTREKISCWEVEEGCRYLKCSKACSECEIYMNYLKYLK